MKKTVLLMLLSLGLVATGWGKSDPLPEIRSGRYGVCSFAGDAGRENMIELSLNADGSFHYQNRFDPGHVVDVRGNWVRKGKGIVLEGYGEGVKIHRKWKLAGSDACLKSRKGLYWVRLCDLGTCE